MKKNNFENQIADKFDNFSVKPPEMVWENVEKNINKKKANSSSFFKFFTNKAFLWFLLIGISGYSVFYHLNNNNQNSILTFDDSSEEDSLFVVNPINTEKLPDSENKLFIETSDNIDVIGEEVNNKNAALLTNKAKTSSSLVSELSKQLVIITEHYLNPKNGLYNVMMSLSDTSNIKYVDWVCRDYDFYSSNMTLPIAFADSAESYEVEAVVTFKDNDKRLFTTQVSVMNPPRVVVPQNFNPKRQHFYIRSENLSYFKIEIINPRTNKVVFKSTNKDKKWDGKDLLNKKCESGEYFVEINFKGSTGEIRTEITKLNLSN